jgi:hypothetical protein
VLNAFVVAAGNNPVLVIFMVILFFVVFFALGVAIGNVTAMRLLLKFGFPVLSGKIVKDYRLLRSVSKDGAGWLKVPDICYAPIMFDQDGLYKKSDYRKRESVKGELYLSDGKSSLDLRGIAHKSDKGIPDLSMIIGSSSIRGNNLRDSQFTNLKKYVNTDLKKHHPDILLIDYGKLRIFNLAFAVEVGLEQKQRVGFTDRASFIKSMQETAYIDTGRSCDNDVIILSGSTGIDTLLVFLVEKSEV